MMAAQDHRTVDMFPDLPRDPEPKPDDRLPKDVRGVIKHLRQMAKARHMSEVDKLALEKACSLLLESWRNAP